VTDGDANAAGALNSRVVLQAPQATPDGAGGETVAWTTVATLWAELRPTGGGESFAFERAEPTVGWRVRIRFRDDVAPDMRFAIGPRVLEIRAAFDPDGRRAFLECLAEERGQ
jgi:SPP1 family predicted phage head-tail adaptor